jgi:hypothetical protein
MREEELKCLFHHGHIVLSQKSKLMDVFNKCTLYNTLLKTLDIDLPRCAQTTEFGCDINFNDQQQYSSGDNSKLLLRSFTKVL